MKGFTKDGKFHPIKPYNKVRKKRLDYNDPELMQHAGVKIIKDDSGKFVRMKRKGTRIKKRLRQPTVTIRTFTDKNGKKDYLVMFAGVGHYHETTRREAEASKKHLMKHIQAERKKGKIFKRGWERKARGENPFIPSSSSSKNVEIAKDHVVIFDDDGREVVYWDKKEWEDEPEIKPIIKNYIKLANQGKVEEIKEAIKPRPEQRWDFNQRKVSRKVKNDYWKGSEYTAGKFN